MIKVLRELFFWIFLLFIIFITFFTYIVIKSDYKLAHQSHMVWKPPHNWNAHYFVIPVKKFLIKLFGSDAKGLPAIKIYVEKFVQWAARGAPRRRAGGRLNATIQWSSRLGH